MKPWGIMVTAGCRGRILPRQCSADGEEGRCSECREYRSCLPFVLVRALQVDRDRHRAAPVRARGRVLCEADRVATVTVHRAAAGLVSVEHQPGSVDSGPGWFRRAARDELALLLPHLGAEEPSADVAADKPVQVEWRRDDASGGSGPARRETLADVLGRGRALPAIAVDKRRGQLGAGRKAGLREFERPIDQVP
jgi:hypothetical protein